MKLADIQKCFDLKKYEESKAAKKDLCGTYEFCYLCNKKNKYPCATAFKKHNKGGATNVNKCKD